MNEETRVVESDIVKGEYLLERLGFYNEYIMLGTFSIYNNTKGFRLLLLQTCRWSNPN